MAVNINDELISEMDMEDKNLKLRHLLAKQIDNGRIELYAAFIDDETAKSHSFEFFIEDWEGDTKEELANSLQSWVDYLRNN